MRTVRPIEPLRARLGRFAADARAGSAVEFAILCGPFLFLILYILQLGLYFMTQSALDTGIVRTANDLQRSYNAAGPPSMPTGAALKTLVATNAGGLIRTNDPTYSDATFSVEIRQFGGLSGGVVPIVDGTNDYGSKSSVLVLRAQKMVTAIAPGVSSLTRVRSSAIIRRQGR